MRLSRFVLLTAVAAVAILIATDRLTAQGAASTGSRTVYITAVDDKGVPVPGLTAADFVIKESGRTQQVLGAVPATTPVTVALMIDDSGVGLQSMREGAAAFVTRLRGLATVSLITTGGRNITLVDYTDSTAALMSGLNRIYSRNVTGAFLTDGIVAATEQFSGREVTRPVIVSLGVEGEDFSEVRPAEVFAALQRTRTQLYMVRLGRPIIGQSNALGANRGESLADEQTRFNAVLGQAPSRTGGRIEQLALHSGIPRLMSAIAEELAGQYEVTYATPQPAGIDLRLEVSTPRRGVKVRAPTRVGLPRP